MDSSLGAYADENGIIGTESLVQYLQTLAEATGAPLSQVARALCHAPSARAPTRIRVRVGCLVLPCP